MPTTITSGALAARNFGFANNGIAHWGEQVTVAASVQLFGAVADPATNIVLAGARAGVPLMAKLSPFGAVQWQRTLSGTGSPRLAADVAIDSSGNLYFVGGMFNGVTSNLFLAKYDAFGAIQFQKTLAAALIPSTVSSVVVDNSGNIYLGCTNGTFPAVTMLNSSGVAQWSKYFTLTSQSGSVPPYLTTDGTSVYGVFPTIDGGGVGYSAAFKIGNTGTLAWGTSVAGLDTSTTAYSSGCPVIIGSNLYNVGTGVGSGAIYKRVASTGACTLSLGVSTADVGGKGSTDGSNGYYFGGNAAAIEFGLYKADVTSTPVLSWSRTVSVSGFSGSSPTAAAIASGSDLYGLSWGTNATDAGSAVKVRQDGTITGAYGAFTYASVAVGALTTGAQATADTITANAFTVTSAAGAMTDAAGAVTFSNTRFT